MCQAPCSWHQDRQAPSSMPHAASARLSGVSLQRTVSLVCVSFPLFVYLCALYRLIPRWGRGVQVLGLSRSLGWRRVAALRRGLPGLEEGGWQVPGTGEAVWTRVAWPGARQHRL